MSTTSIILAEHGFSQRIAKVSSYGIIVEPRKLAEICFNWINQQRDAGLLGGDLLLIGSIDFTFTKHSTSRPQTFAIRGGLVKIISPQS